MGDRLVAGRRGWEGVRSALVGIGLICMGLLGGQVGCKAKAMPQPAAMDGEHVLSAPVSSEELEAVCRPPVGWRVKAVEQLPRSIQRVWVSPSGRTAYGVIRIRLPLPAGQDLVLWAFLNKMRQAEGEAKLVSRDKGSPGLRFVAEGGEHRLRALLHTSGLSAWVVYAGTLVEEPEAPEELRIAELARDATWVGSVGR